MNEECEKKEEKKRDKLSKSKGQRGRERVEWPKSLLLLAAEWC